MKRYLLDTGILGHYVYKRQGVHERLAAMRMSGCIIGTCMLVYGEVLFGAYRSNNVEGSLRIIKQRTRLVRWPYTEKAAHHYGEIAAYLRSIGQPIQQVDIQTAAIALTLGNCTIVTTDNDFARIPGLSLENWRTP